MSKMLWYIENELLLVSPLENLCMLDVLLFTFRHFEFKGMHITLEWIVCIPMI